MLLPLKAIVRNKNVAPVDDKRQFFVASFLVVENLEVGDVRGFDLASIEPVLPFFESIQRVDVF